MISNNSVIKKAELPLLTYQKEIFFKDNFRQNIFFDFVTLS